MKCYHHNDLDGRCAAAIVYKRFGKEVEFIEMDYHKKVDIDSIQEGEKIIIVDFSFKPEEMNKVLKKTKEICWIDHHKTAFEYETKYDEMISGLRVKGKAGCVLTWEYFYPDVKTPRAVELIGDRDVWAWKYGRETALFNEGIKIYNTDPTFAIWGELLDEDADISKYLEQGRICIKYRDNFCSDYVKSYGFECEFEGYKCFASGLYMFGSEAFGELMNKYDICISFEFTGKKWIISLYSKTVDVSLIAKMYGGGGHTGAAGFVFKGSNPFTGIIYV